MTREEEMSLQIAETPAAEQGSVGPGDSSPAPEDSKWGFEEADEIAPGLSAIKLLGGGLRYEAYLAWDESRRSLVVAKVVRPGLIEDRRTLAGLEAESEMLQRLSHPVLLRSFAAELAGPRPHLVLEHLEGPRLSSLLRRYGPLPPEQLIPLALQLCAAVHYMAREGYVHLDVKPSNIIMAGPPRLIDLSVARSIVSCPEVDSPVGTDAYMAPEQCRGEGPAIGPAADVWGIGATLYRAVAGKRPFPREQEEDRDSADPAKRFPQLHLAPAPLEGLASGEVTETILACLQPNPSSRPEAGEVGDRLEHVLAALPKPKLSKLKPRLGNR